MRSPGLLLLLFLVPFANSQSANETIPKTEAQQDGFSGPVRSVGMLSDWNYAPWIVSHIGHHPVADMTSRAFRLVPVISCRVCDYDTDGNRTRSGQFISDGNNQRFAGSDIAIVRDPAGRMIERTITEAGTGKLFSHDWFGPFGPTRSLMYINGKPSGSRTRKYDSAGHLVEDVFTDADGNTVDRITSTYNDRGQRINRVDAGRGGQLKSLDTYDPASDTQHYQEFDSSNALKTEFTVAHNQTLSYWSAAEVPGRNEGITTAYFPGSDVYQFRCRKNGDCETFRIHHEYLNGDYNLQTAVERHDATGALIDAAYVEYTVDEHHNWTTRKIWVLSPELPQRTLYEVDARSITYWPR